MFSLAYSIHLQPTDLEKSFQGRKKSKWCHKIVHLFTLCCEKLLCFVHVFFLILWFQVDNIWGELHARGTCTWFFFFFFFFLNNETKWCNHKQLEIFRLYSVCCALWFGVWSKASTVPSSHAKQQKPPAPYVCAHQWVHMPYAWMCWCNAFSVPIISLSAQQSSVH